jgi:hypothetical protein
LKHWDVLLAFAVALFALLIIPWDAVWLLANPLTSLVYENPSFNTEVRFPLHGGTVSFAVNGTILLHAKAAISADNPIIAEVFIANSPLKDLSTVTNTTQIAVGFDGTLRLPLTWTSIGYQGGIIFINVASFPWNGYGSVSIVYLSSGEFDVIARFLDSRGVILQQITLVNDIVVGPQQETLTYVTSIAFVSTDLIIVVLMLLDLKDIRADDGSRRQKKQTETEP